MARHEPLYLELPWPPSENTYRRYLGGRFAKPIISAAGRQYKKAVIYAVLEQTRGKIKPIEGRVRMDIRLHAPNHRKYDIDNRLKALCDALTAAHAWRDDEQVDMITLTRQNVVPGGLVEVWIEEIWPKQKQGRLL